MFIIEQIQYDNEWLSDYFIGGCYGHDRRVRSTNARRSQLARWRHTATTLLPLTKQSN